MKTKTQTQTTEFSLNFGGFYHSEHSETIENNIESYGYDWEDVDYKKTHLNYCNAYLNKLSEELEINLTFIQLDSPREYNFTTDKIFCSISNKDFKALLDAYDTKELFNYIEEQSKSRDGFSSFYSGYAAVKKEKDIFLQYLFDYILEYESFDFYDLEFEVQLNKTNLINK
tara:strand:- start:571 stop:1083 length:513 start_codon:yes stop_codon:yes gene_type:complete